MSDVIKRLLSECVSQQVLKQAPPPRRLDKALLVTKVAEVSLAKALGIKAGDLLIDINGRPGAEKDLWEWSQQSSLHSYEFYLTDTQQTLRLHTNGIPLGFNSDKTDEAIKAQYLRGKGDYQDLVVLWERYEWKILEQISAYWLKKRGFIEKLFCKLSQRETIPNDVEWLFQAVTLYERGNCERGMEVMEQFGQECASSWQTTYSGIVLYYRAREQLRAGNREEALEAFLYAYDYIDSKPTANEIGKLGGEVPEDNCPWEGKVFPYSYHLPMYYDKAQQVGLTDSIAQLVPGALHMICVLGSYRSNQPYDRFIQRFIVFTKYFPKVFNSLHIITQNEKEGIWQAAESEAIEAGLNVKVLLDKNNDVARAIDGNSSPDVFVVGSDGRILLNDRLSHPVDMWNLLDKLFCVE